MSKVIFPKKIILASDGSKHSLKAAQKVVQLIKSNNSMAIIVHVLEVYGVMEMEKEDKTLENGKNVIASTKRIFDEAGLSVDTRLLVGNTAQAIIDFARNERADLIVVGATSHGGVSARLLGSVAESIARNASCPVLIIR